LKREPSISAIALAVCATLAVMLWREHRR